MFFQLWLDSDSQKDCDLRISNIRESININNRNFKTSNVNLEDFVLSVESFLKGEFKNRTPEILYNFKS